MLQHRGVDFSYRDYRQEPLDEDELRQLFDRLGLRPGEVLRRRDKAFRELSLTGEEDDSVLIEYISVHPTLLERPIGLAGDRAVIGRPPERLLELTESR